MHPWIVSSRRRLLAVWPSQLDMLSLPQPAQSKQRRAASPWLLQGRGSLKNEKMDWGRPSEWTQVRLKSESKATDPLLGRPPDRRQPAPREGAHVVVGGAAATGPSPLRRPRRCPWAGLAPSITIQRAL